MLASVIKLKYRCTIDFNNPEDEPCPLCGKVVCHVLEDPYKVFCTNSTCSFQDETNDDWDKPIIDRFNYLIQHSLSTPVFLRRLDHEYSDCNRPFLIKEDLQQRKFIVRDFRLDEEKYNSKAARWAGLSEDQCYLTNSPVVAKYASIKLLVKDGWRTVE